MKTAEEVIESGDVRREIERILNEALSDPGTVLNSSRGMDVLLDAIICTFRDAVRDEAKPDDLSADEAYELVRRLYEKYGVTPKLREAYEFYQKWKKSQPYRTIPESIQGRDVPGFQEGNE
ncbi:hypothetical protein [Hyphomicrobium sp.]|uniref:hypothetical protein n=1 Tax=Hyphomicrobium sp. TaxID=82 RepID=UPI001D45D54A|nr:hypothetical protein [Hyphomicrobium sp.]MBY0559913.1 hypothetical protein [Hyphomicrobium sp.]